MTLSLAFKEKKSTLNSLFLKWKKSIESASKIIVDKVENNGVIYDILVKLKAVGAKVCMLSTSQNSISIFVDDNTLIPCVYTLKSYFNL
jgi:aspartokinase